MSRPATLFMGYMSPEQIRGFRTNLDFRSDCFLIGICLYEIIAKINPYTQNFTGEREYAERVLHGNVDPVSSFDNSVPAALNELIMRFLKPYANLRPRTFNVIYTLLDRAAEEV
jgi:serine/threonine protein kinase